MRICLHSQDCLIPLIGMQGFVLDADRVDFTACHLGLQAKAVDQGYLQVICVKL